MSVGASYRWVASTDMAGRIRTAVVPAALFIVAAACSGGAGGASGGSLRSALASVSDVPASEHFFAWADGKELRRLTGVAGAADVGNSKTNQKWLRLTEVALPSVAGKEPQFTAATGIDAYRGSRYITVGVPADRASRVDGADGAAVLRQFRQLGARERQVAGRTYLAVADESQVNISNPRLGNDVYLILNRVYASGSTVAFGLSDQPMTAVLGGGRTLADAPTATAVADCLGDVFVAEIFTPPPGAAAGTRLFGLGVRRPAAADSPVSEVLCEVTSGQDQARSLIATIGSRVAPNANLPATTLQVRDRVSQAGVEQVANGGQPLVRLTLDLVGPARAGFLFYDEGPEGVAFLAGGSEPVPQP
jgi:hypothetical protein